MLSQKIKLSQKVMGPILIFSIVDIRVAWFGIQKPLTLIPMFCQSWSKVWAQTRSSRHYYDNKKERIVCLFHYFWLPPCVSKLANRETYVCISASSVCSFYVILNLQKLGKLLRLLSLLKLTGHTANLFIKRVNYKDIIINTYAKIFSLWLLENTNIWNTPSQSK